MEEAGGAKEPLEAGDMREEEHFLSEEELAGFMAVEDLPAQEEAPSLSVEEELSIVKSYDLWQEEDSFVSSTQEMDAFLQLPEVKELIPVLRREMVARNTRIEKTIVLPSDRAIMLSQGDLSPVCDALYQAIYEETGVGNEGDYLHYSCMHMEFGFSIKRGAGNYYYILTLMPTYSDTAEEEQILSYHMQAVRENLHLDQLRSEEEKLRFLYIFLTGFIHYDDVHVADESYLPQYSAYSALVKGTSVCQGIALVLYRFLTDLGIPNRVVIGYLSGGRHIWNLVQIQGKYYHCDATLDLGKGEQHFNYFLIGEGTLSRDHVRRDYCAVEPFLSTYPASAYDYGSKEEEQGLRAPYVMEAGDAGAGFLVVGLKEPVTLQGKDIPFTVTGAGADAIYGEDLVEGDVKWTPMGWALAGGNDIYDIPKDGQIASSRTYSLPASLLAGAAGEEKEILLAFSRYYWKENAWQAGGTQGDDEIAFVSIPLRIYGKPSLSFASYQVTIYTQGEESITKYALSPVVKGVFGEKSISYKSSNEKVAIVSEDGVVKAISKGSATI
ncbi:MAG: hypothetical protein IIZ39_06785, partial [Blautia sp.]|nr:hypothetical protein [Blautia sp.]